MKILCDLIDGDIFIEILVSDNELSKVREGKMLTIEEKIQGKEINVGLRIGGRDYAA